MATTTNFIPMQIYQLPTSAIRAIFKDDDETKASAEMHVSGKWVRYNGVTYPVVVDSSSSALALKEHTRRKLMKRFVTGK